MKRFILRITKIVLSIVVIAIIAGSIYEAIGRRKAAHEFPPPGRMIDIGGRRIQLDCRGTGSPTVVFEAGHDLHGSLSWSMIHGPVAKVTRACTYSRAGIMWSDPSNGPTNGKSIAEDLNATLSKAGEKPPFILVGHSLGGPYIMTYTKYHADEVAGLVFVDASHPEQSERLKMLSSGKFRWIYKLGTLLSWSGIVRAVAPEMSQKALPNQPSEIMQPMAAYASTSIDASYKEFEAIEATLQEAGTFRKLGNRPLFVLTSMAPFSPKELAGMNWTPEEGAQFKEAWSQLQADEATWSSRSEHQVITDAGHYIQFDRPDLVIAAVLSVVEQVRKNEQSLRGGLSSTAKVFTDWAFMF